MPRFVILRHEIGPGFGRTDQSHFDWMFESDGSLRTWATEMIDSLAESIEVDARSLADHRLHYLQFEGKIDGGRGHVTQVIKGTFVLTEQSGDRFAADLNWCDKHGIPRTATVAIYRNCVGEFAADENACDWRLRFSLCR